MTPERYRRIVAVLARRQPDLTVILEGVHKPHNLSAIQRSCDAVGVLEAHAIAPERPYRVHKATASGSARWVEVHSHARVADAIDRLRARGYRIHAAHLSPDAIDFREPDYTQPTAFLLGTEKYGVSEHALALADAHVSIPMYGMVASLNVSVAAALLLYEAQRQRRAAGLYDRCRLEPGRYQALLFRWGYPRLASRFDALGLAYPQVGEDGQIIGTIPPEIHNTIRR
jgi:tRNA (guanosine-2'-O-)-methyltransferase